MKMLFASEYFCLLTWKITCSHNSSSNSVWIPRFSLNVIVHLHLCVCCVEPVSLVLGSLWLMRLQSSLSLIQKTNFWWPLSESNPLGWQHSAKLWTLRQAQPAVIWSRWNLSGMLDSSEHHPGDEWACQCDERPSGMKDLGVCAKQLVLWKAILKERCLIYNA